MEGYNEREKEINSLKIQKFREALKSFGQLLVTVVGKSRYIIAVLDKIATIVIYILKKSMSTKIVYYDKPIS
jgi:hypothetical protein